MMFRENYINADSTCYAISYASLILHSHCQIATHCNTQHELQNNAAVRVGWGEGGTVIDLLSEGSQHRGEDIYTDAGKTPPSDS